DRIGNISTSSEWLNSKKAMQGLLDNLAKNPKDYKSMLALTEDYIQEARVTGDYAYYDKASLELLAKVLKNDPKNFDALTLKALILLSQHHFSDALDVGKEAVAINPYNAFIYGVLDDANLELGRYDSAVKMADKMTSIRPDLRSYARISYLREIYGDIPGAISAIKLAVSSGYPGLEQTEWARMILGHLYEIEGQIDSAQIVYQKALTERPDYPFGYAGLGRIQKEKGNYPEAIKYFEKAKDMILEYSFKDELTDLYRLNNQPTKGDQSAQDVIEELGGNLGDESQSIHGHYADKELAYAYLKTNPADLDKALKHALIEYDRRPDNIDVCEAVAWVRYKRGEFAQADTLINKALRTHSKNPILLCHAGLIKVKAGETANGVSLIKAAVQQDPYFDINLRKEAAPYISSN
ncbi:MAG TPA: tetratricopeptide repeat protein, partial [Bacteroidia bacterium]|nr:tetratricopeptide repeat protein [Bacteroidia bacterium]